MRSSIHPRISASLLVVAALVGCARKHVDELPQASTRCFSVLGWNDLHGQLEADEPVIDSSPLPAGGVVALADSVDRIRSEGESVFVLDAGDLFTGPMTSTLAEGRPVIAAYNVLGVDAVSVGNHEFDFGPVGYARVSALPGAADDDNGPRGALYARMKEASFPFVSANVQGKGGTPIPWPNLRPHVALHRGPWTIGVVGYTTAGTPRTTIGANVRDLDFTVNAATRVAASIRALRAQGASPIVLLAHASLEGTLPQSLGDLEDPDGLKHTGELATLLDEMGADRPDLILAGHRHAWMMGRLRGIPIVSSEHHGVGFARARFCGSPGHTALVSLERRIAFASNPPATALGRAVAEAIEPYSREVRAMAERPVGVLADDCAVHHARGTVLLETIASAMLARSPSANVALINTGAVRTSLHAGTVRYRDLFAALPFENALATCTTTRRDLVRGLARLAKKASARDHFPFGLAGAKVRARHVPSGVEIVDLELDAEHGKKRLPDDAELTVALPDFLLAGGDGFVDAATCSRSATLPENLRELVGSVVALGLDCGGLPKNIEVEIP